MSGRRMALFFLMILLAVGTVPVVSAQFRMGPPRMSGLWNPTVGSGAVYSMHRKGKSEGEIQFTVVGKETVAGGTGHWVELSMSSPEMGGEMVYKSLFVVTSDQLVVKRVVIQMAGQPPMEMPMEMQMQMGGGRPQSADISKDKDVVLVGTESITVPAGTFTCQHYRSSSGDAWVAASVAPYGLVKTTSKDSEMVLVRVVSNAKSRIVGTPVPFDPMKMMGQPPNE